jgi:ectoine hydroxylase-related dioxygenase (phytanoyl-CoA dioxygenase family)
VSAPDLADHLQRLDRDGFTVVRDAFDVETAEALDADLDRLERELGIGPGTNGFEGRTTTANSMWAVTDFTEANGATRLIPGTHRADSSPVYGQHYPSICAEMPRGSILVWHGSLWHGGGANTTSQRRRGIAMNYCAGWVRQQENQQLGIPLDTVRRFSPALQELCGFGTYRGLIGHIDKQTARQRVLGVDDPTGMLWDRT